MSPFALRLRLRRPAAAVNLAAIALVVALAGPAVAAPEAIVLPVQGALIAAGGGPVSDGVYALTFRLYAELKAEAPLWKEIHVAVPVVGGLFDVLVGGEDPAQALEASFFQLHPASAIGVQVSGDPELPRKRLFAVPYAATAHLATIAAQANIAIDADHAKTADALACTGCITADHLAAGTLDAKMIAYASAGGAPSNVHTELAKLLLALKAVGTQVGVGKVPADLCGLDLASDAGPSCVDGAPALWTRFASNDGEMSKLAEDGQIVYRKDQAKAWMRVQGKWRKLLFEMACGDGFVEGVEECDDGPLNANLADKCRTNCAKPGCGDQIVDTGEQCDDGNNVTIDDCVVCKAAKCGDGFLQVGVEACDDGDLNADTPDKCRTTCAKPACGDAIADTGEQCDDGNESATDACVACKTAFCGDGHILAGVEACDDGGNNADAPDKCRKNCKKPTCGDGITDAGEECDDGNVQSNDGCSALCVSEGCTPKGGRQAFNTLVADSASGCWDGNPCQYDSYSWNDSHGQSFQGYGQQVSCGGTTACIEHIGITTYDGSTTVCQGKWDVFCGNDKVGTIESNNTKCAGSAMGNGCKVDFTPRECSTVRLVAVVDNNPAQSCCEANPPGSMITGVSAW